MFKESKFQIHKKQEKNGDIMSFFSEGQRDEIEKKRRILSSLAFFIGKDFKIPVELNEPGQGWHWDFKNNIIRIDPKDLLEKPMDYLRFVISHEGGHRRISRTEFIPLEVWQKPGFSFMMNSIEDPRDNNFVAENYPKFKDQMELAYNHDLDIEAKAKYKAQEKLGYQPKFMQAGFEYIKQWFKEVKGEESEISETLSEDVKQAVQKTLKSAQDSWWRYPSRQEADDHETGEETIKKYAKISYEINLEEIWPEFKKLVEEDMKDQQMQELMKDMQKEKGESAQEGLPQGLKDKLSPEEQKELESAIEKAIESAIAKAKADKEAKDKNAEGQAGQEEKGDEQTEEIEEGMGGKEGVPIDLDSLSDELKQKIKDYLDSLPEDKKKELEAKAKQSLKDFEKEASDELEGKLSDNPEKSAAAKVLADKKEAIDQEENKIEKEKKPTKPKKESEEFKKYKDLIEKTLKKNANIYEQYRREVLPIIEKLENDLREIFVARRANKWISGFKAGKRIDIKKRIQEKAKGVPAIESKAWQKREMPDKKDYAISLLVDLSGSMQGEKIKETFKAVIVLSEVLNRLSIKTEILGFNDRLYEYQKYDQQISKAIRENMGGMLKEVSDFGDTGKAKWNDDGWALKQASKRLGKQRAGEKFLIVLSDGHPEESPAHPASKYDLQEQVNNILKETDQKLIGLGIGFGTKHVEEYYPNSLADISVKEMQEKLARLIREVIVNYDKF